MEIKNKKSDIPTNYLCIICNKFYASHSSLCNHNKKFHKIETITHNKDIAKECKDIIKETSKEVIDRFQCRYCDKIYKHKQTRWTHEQICKNKTKKIDEKELLKNEISDLKDKI